MKIEDRNYTKKKRETKRIYRQRKERRRGRGAEI